MVQTPTLGFRDSTVKYNTYVMCWHMALAFINWCAVVVMLLKWK